MLYVQVIFGIAGNMYIYVKVSFQKKRSKMLYMLRLFPFAMNIFKEFSSYVEFCHISNSIYLVIFVQ